MKLSQLILWLIFLFVAYNISGQSLSNKQTLNEIMNDVDARFQGQERIAGVPKYKHFARWSHWWSSRVNPDGTFNNVSQKNSREWNIWKRQNENYERSSEASWSFIGPDVSTYANNGTHCKGNGYGRADRISFHPTDANKLYVCTPDGGAWHSADGGSTWSCLTNNLPILGCAGIAVDPSNSSTLYLLTGTTDNSTGDLVGNFGYRYPSIGILKSIDHGENWEPILDFDTIVPNTPIIPYRLKMHPLDDNIIIATTDNGVFRTEDKGASWLRVQNGRYYDIEFHPTNVNFMYISSRGFVNYSNDKGLSWFTATGVPNCNRRVEIAVSPDSPNNVWLVSGGVTGGGASFCGYAKSTDMGVSFTNIITTPNLIGYVTSGGTSIDQSNYDLCIAVDDNFDQRVVIGGIEIFRTQNYDSNPNIWTNIAPYWEATGSQQGTLPSNYLHPDVHDLAFNPLDGKLYSCSDGGVYVSTNNGTSWNNISQGIHSSQIYHLSLAPSNDNKIGIGLQDNGLKSRFSSSSQDFRHIQSGDGFEPVFDPNDSDIVVSSINTSVYRYNTITSTNRDSLYADGNTFFHPLSYKPASSNKLYIGSNPMLIHDFSLSSNTATATPGATASWEIATCDDVTSRVYIAGGSNDYRNDSTGTFHTSFNSGVTFTDRSTVSGFPSNSELVKITDIAVDPNDCSDVAFSNGGYEAGEKVYYSLNSGGSNWINISYNLPNVPVHALEIDNDGNFYAGTELGVFYLPFGTTFWLPFYNQMPQVPVTDLTVSNSGTKLIASTFGRGVWESFLPGTCSINQNLSSSIEGTKFYEASDNIMASSLISGGVGTNVNFHAGDRITLTPGFKVTQNSRFKAKITPCGTPPDNQ